MEEKLKEENEKLRKQIESMDERVKKLEMYYTRLRSLTVTMGLDILRRSKDAIMGWNFDAEITKAVREDEYLPRI